MESYANLSPKLLNEMPMRSTSTVDIARDKLKVSRTTSEFIDQVDARTGSLNQNSEHSSKGAKTTKSGFADQRKPDKRVRTRTFLQVQKDGYQR